MVDFERERETLEERRGERQATVHDADDDGTGIGEIEGDAHGDAVDREAHRSGVIQALGPLFDFTRRCHAERASSAGSGSGC